jgi:hypothetical protein
MLGTGRLEPAAFAAPEAVECGFIQELTISTEGAIEQVKQE